MAKYVIILTHPNMAESKMNKTLIDSVKSNPDIEVRDLYSMYGNLKLNEQIDIKAEQEAIEGAEKIILQFPFYWFSAPPLLKKWLDEVLTYDWAYGKSQRLALKGKQFYVANTFGTDEAEYSPIGSEAYYVTDFLTPYFSIAKYCQMLFSGNFKFFPSDNPETKGEEYLKWILSSTSPQK